MSIILLILATICFFCFTVLPMVKHRVIYAVISLLVMLTCGSLIILNDSFNFGMQVETTKTTKSLASSASKDLDVLLYQPLGTKNERVYLYKTDADAKKPTATKTTDSVAKYTTNAKKATLVITEERYVYKNSWAKAFFGILNNSGRLKKRTYNFQIPNDWYVLSTSQAKALQKLIKQHKTQMQQDIAQVIQAELATELQKNPTMSSSERESLVKKLQQKATKETLDKLVAKVKASKS